jgi:hypothetical protein
MEIPAARFFNTPGSPANMGCIDMSLTGTFKTKIETEKVFAI